MSSLEQDLSRRERQALDILFKRKSVTVSELIEDLADTPSYSAARALLNVLVEKDLATVKTKSGARAHVYSPASSPKRAQKGALKRILGTFFDNSPGKLAANLLDPRDTKLAPDEIKHLRELLDAHDKSNREKSR